MNNQQKDQWNLSYENRGNYVFSPHEEVVRFFAKYIRKRIHLKEFEDKVSFAIVPKILDLGCGIGRHIIFSKKMGLEAYGIDLSGQAVVIAQKWAALEGCEAPAQYIKEGSVDKLPWIDGFFDFMVSHGVLDSMEFVIAKWAVQEASRVLKPAGLFYCDVVSGDDSAHSREFAGEECVTTAHEKNTIQSFFNFTKLENLFLSHFDILECVLVKREDVQKRAITARYHLVLRKKAA